MSSIFLCTEVSSDVLSWMHIGDLHLTKAGQPNHPDLKALISAANRNFAGAIDFIVLPGDNAGDGTEQQFGPVRDAIVSLRVPLHILPGDHDFKPRNLDAFYRMLGADERPKAVTTAGVRCLFFDVVSAGSGGPGFRVDTGQIEWLAGELRQADQADQCSVIFMHTYPADLKQGGAALCALLARHPVVCVDMGHTHYNELANDGYTIYAATRSTGQNEEGPVGFSMAAVDNGVVSWRFKPLAEAWPFVLITSPADARLIIDPRARNQIPRGLFDARAKAWSGKALPLRVAGSMTEAGVRWCVIPVTPAFGNASARHWAAHSG
ncbi:MAG: metallophosphoesterase [Acetobacteraceae bacterium]|nr:metallophosphoesterase [Acetobacteraceae bacterium]